MRQHVARLYFVGISLARVKRDALGPPQPLRWQAQLAHGEGFADFSQRGDAAAVKRAMRFGDHRGAATEVYPCNPNGSPEGLTSVTTPDGRFTVLMPHAERVFRNVQLSWTDADRSAASPWTRMFGNARVWVG